MLAGVQTLPYNTVTSSMTLLLMCIVDAGCLGVAEKGDTTVVPDSAVLSLITDGTGIDSALRCLAGHHFAVLAVPVPVSVLALQLSLSYVTTSTEIDSSYLPSPMIQLAPPLPSSSLQTRPF